MYDYDDDDSCDECDCHSYCSHGGYCTLDNGHEGQHDSGYCQWSDEDSLSKPEADDVIRKTAREQGFPDVDIERIVAQ